MFFGVGSQPLSPSFYSPSLNFLVLADAFRTHLYFKKVKPINVRNATRSRVATSHRFFYITATTLSLPVFRLTSLRVFAGAAQLLFILVRRLCSLGYHPQVLSPTTRE
jgi:hypothetical protein